MKKYLTHGYLYCSRYLLPFLSFMTLFDYNWLLITTQTGLNGKGWLTPTAICYWWRLCYIYHECAISTSGQVGGCYVTC